MADISIFKPRTLTNILSKPDSNKIVLVTGARQTGKSTLVTHYYKDMLYLNLDAPEIRQQLRKISTFQWQQTVGTAIIDEAQKEPSIFEKIKFNFDAGKISFSVLLGSSQILLLKNIRESLAGRVSIYELFPLMVSELSTPLGNPVNAPLITQFFSSGSINDVLSNHPATFFGDKQQSLKDSEEYLLGWGGMPALLELAPQDRWQWLKDYEQTYLERDLRDIANISDLDPFHKLQRIAALRSGKLLNFSELARDVGISVDTVRRYIEYLRMTYQAALLQPFYNNTTKSMVKTPKLYWLDNGIWRYLTGYMGQVTGELFETYVINEIYKLVKTNRLNWELFFYRTTSGSEVDLIISYNQKILGCEIKMRDTIYPQDIKNLVKLSQEFKTNWYGGIVIYRGDTLYKIANSDIWVIPSWMLLS
ncbi:MAG: ATPase [Burkholderiales bacterium]|jgi:predicted AAA+ superfamily ATPase|nr:ATPase [Burkholderiales bacterium]